MDKWILLGLFLIFVVIRLCYGKTHEPRERFHHKRELILSTIFTFSLLGTTILFLFTPQLDEAVVGIPELMRWSGVGIALAGNLMLWWVHWHLGANFSPHLELRAEHTLITDGPYRYLRHPMYTSGVLYLVGCGLFSNNWWMLLLPLSTFLLLILCRLTDEEEMLSIHFAEAWNEYKSKTYAFLPFIW